MLFKPFKALRPLVKYADKVISPPYDVVNSAEAKKLAEGNAISFLHISKPEIDLPEDITPYSQKVYEKGEENLNSLIKDGILTKEDVDCYYVYRITMGNHTQTGIAGLASSNAYQKGIIKKHEFTLPVKEDDRFNQIKTLKAQTGPVLLTYKSSDEITKIIAKIILEEPLYNVKGPNETIHEIWAVSDEKTLTLLANAFDNLGEMFIADGHHRFAAGSRVASEMKENNQSDDLKYDGILSVAFADNEMNVLPYNRTIRDLNGYTPDELISKIKENGFSVELSINDVNPESKLQFGMYIGGKWYLLSYVKEVSEDAVTKLDVSILSSNIFNKLFNITDLRNDRRISFIGGIRGTKELEKLVNSGEFKVAFSLFHTPINDMIDVARTGAVMPPKSTWFEPKLADGLLSNQF